MRFRWQGNDYINVRYKNANKIGKKNIRDIFIHANISDYA